MKERGASVPPSGACEKAPSSGGGPAVNCPSLYIRKAAIKKRTNHKSQSHVKVSGFCGVGPAASVTHGHDGFGVGRPVEVAGSVADGEGVGLSDGVAVSEVVAVVRTLGRGEMLVVGGGGGVGV